MIVAGGGGGGGGGASATGSTVTRPMLEAGMRPRRRRYAKTFGLGASVSIAIEDVSTEYWLEPGSLLMGLSSTTPVERLSCGHARKVMVQSNDPFLRDMLLGDLAREYEIYQRIGKRPHFLEMIEYSPSKGMLMLQGLPNGTLRDYLVDHAKDIPDSQRLHLAVQISEVVQTLHSLDIIHCDIKPENALLDENLQAYLIDFAGSIIDEKPSTIMENDRFRLADEVQGQYASNSRTEIFALCSTIFEIMTSHQPCADISDDEVVKRYREETFPDVASIPCGDVILSCWRSQFTDASEVHAALQGCAKAS
nr:rgs domain-containing serine/threonine-protein kinase a [Quercus suber]